MASKIGETYWHRATHPEPTPACVGESLPCWDAKRRVWQALDLRPHHAQTAISSPPARQTSPSLATTPVRVRPRARRQQVSQ